MLKEKQQKHHWQEGDKNHAKGEETEVIPH